MNVQTSITAVARVMALSPSTRRRITGNRAAATPAAATMVADAGSSHQYTWAARKRPITHSGEGRTSIDARAFNKPTEDALKRGIPVVSYNADTPNARLAYVGQNLYQSAFNIAVKWLPMVRKGGHVLLSLPAPGTLSLQPRVDGYIQAIKNAGNPVTYEVLDSGFDPDQEFSRIEQYYLSHRNIAGMFGTSATDTLACGNVSRKYGLAAKGIITAGYDTLPEELALVRSGDLTFTTDQQSYLQGFLPTLQLYLYRLTNGVVRPFDADTSLVYVTRDNVAGYLDAQSRFEGTSDAEPE